MAAETEIQTHVHTFFEFPTVADAVGWQEASVGYFLGRVENRAYSASYHDAVTAPYVLP